MSGPLGRYSQLVAAGIAVVLVIAAIAAHLFAVLGVSVSDKQTLREFALMAIGAVFGAAAAVNGVKPQITAAHKRLDSINAPPARDGEG